MSLRDLPSVDAVVRELDTNLPAQLVTHLVRGVLEEVRATILSGGDTDPSAAIREVVARLELAQHRRIVNATGVLLHTNLGRAPLHPDALQAAHEAAAGYGNLEYDLHSRQRGGRGRFLAWQLTALVGAEDAFVVNNNAAALLLALTALAPSGVVPVSRGELIEIGGSYRLPELMAASGARLVEIGTTNRTRLSDYAAVAGEAALILKVHPSNYRVVGFAEDTPSPDLVDLAAKSGVPFAYDIGSGLLDADIPWLTGPPPAWLAGEPGVRQEVAGGTDLVLFSGDKLLGGPQAGIVVGRADLIEKMKRHPIARAVRADGATMAALSATLDLYLNGAGASIPFWEMATRPEAVLADRLAAILEISGLQGTIGPGASLLGAGSVPGLEIPTPTATLDGSADHIWNLLLTASPPILARRESGSVVLDLRAVDPDDDPHIAKTLAGAAASWR